MLLAVLAAGSGCAGAIQRAGPARLVPRVCPDGAPVKFLQHPACGRVCGYSCLPGRWTVDEG
jgi:hypothetical protein